MTNGRDGNERKEKKNFKGNLINKIKIKKLNERKMTEKVETESNVLVCCYGC